MNRVLYLSLVLVFAIQIKDIRSPIPRTPSAGFDRPPSSYLNFQAPPSQSSNPCDKTKLKKGAPDAHVACHNECMNIKSSVADIYDLYPTYRLVRILNSKCGSVDEGKCAYFRKASFVPICFCYTSDGLNKKQRTPLLACRLGIPFIRKLTNAGIGLTRCATGFGKKADERPQTGNSMSEQEQEQGEEEEEQDGEPEGSVLVTDFYLSGIKIRAKLDTGSGVTLIPRRFAQNILPLDIPREISGITGGMQQVGKTTIDIQTREGITIAVTGLVANIKYDLLIGNDFFLKHAAKIKIPKRKMELSIGGTKMVIPIKFREPFLPGQTAAVRSDPGGYSALKISVVLNGRQTEMMVDTGASYCIIRKDFVNLDNVLPMNTQSLAPDGTAVQFKGKTVFQLTIEGQEFGGWALVPEFNFAYSLITGNIWNKHCVELIDFEQETVTLKWPLTDTRITTRAIVEDMLPPNFPNGT